jgi:hypothetical protein
MVNDVYIASDTHGLINISKIDELNLDDSDYLIIAGDVAATWCDEEYQNHVQDFYNKRNHVTLFIDGNHEHHVKLREYPVIKYLDGNVSKISEKLYWLRRGEIYNIYGNRYFCLGGAKSIDSAKRIEGVSVFSDLEVISYEETCHALDNLSKYSNCIDFIITHSAPHQLIENNTRFRDVYDPTNIFLDHINKYVSFKQWYMGHYHMDKIIKNKYYFVFKYVYKIASSENYKD